MGWLSVAGCIPLYNGRADLAAASAAAGAEGFPVNVYSIKTCGCSCFSALDGGSGMNVGWWRRVLYGWGAAFCVYSLVACTEKAASRRYIMPHIGGCVLYSFNRAISTCPVPTGRSSFN